MNFQNRINIKQSFFIIVGWIFAINLMTWYAIANLKMFLTVAELEHLMMSNIMVQYYHSNYQYLEATLFGLFFGAFFVYINYLFEKSFIKSYSFGKTILLKSVFYVIAFLISFIVIYYILTGFRLVPKEVVESNWAELVPLEALLAVFLFIIVIIFLFNFLIEINRKFGPGNLIKMISGKYQSPKVEDRIFMFLDLKDSTTIAEKLGHLKYSSFIKLCFHYLTDVVIKYKAEIYQYVGDEVVLSWTLKNGLRNSNCVKAFVAYETELNKRSHVFMKKFGISPQFKAGLDMGFVTVTEIGEIKREIAYHGDVLNTASRIQDQCNKLNQKILLSETVAYELNLEEKFERKLVGDINLRGKEKPTSIYALLY